MKRQSNPLLVVGLMLVLIAVGSVVLQREVAETMRGALLLSIAWAGIVGLAFLAYARPRNLLPQVAGGLAVGAVIAGGSYYWFSVRDDAVDEDVVTAAQTADAAEAEQALSGSSGAPRTTAAEGVEPAGNVTLASGSFSGEDGHDGMGTATVIKGADGERTLTFTDFDVDPGAAVEVWLTTGANETDDRIELGDLKGNIGNQQYEVPDDADLNSYGTVVLYCTPFTVRIAVADLKPPAEPSEAPM